MRTFLPRNAVTAAASTAMVSGRVRRLADGRLLDGFRLRGRCETLRGLHGEFRSSRGLHHSNFALLRESSLQGFKGGGEGFKAVFRLEVTPFGCALERALQANIDQCPTRNQKCYYREICEIHCHARLLVRVGSGHAS